MNKIPRRKNIRLKDYDYAQEGYYFVTICTKDRQKLLSNIVRGGLHAAPDVELTVIGKEIIKTINFIENKNSNVIFDKYTIMPNHVHLIMVLLNSQLGRDGTLPLHKIIGQLKSYTNKKYNDIKKTKNLILWQRNYYEHIIRNECEYLETWTYVDTNPAKWEEDKYFI
jgi:putative transposase